MGFGVFKHVFESLICRSKYVKKKQIYLILEKKDAGDIFV